MKRTVVLDIAGLSSSLLGADTPRLGELASRISRIRPVCPAVTCSMQATYLTGKPPAAHGIVGNGWYFRDLSQVLFWRHSNRLVQGSKVWHEGRSRHPSFTCANSFWRYGMVTDADWSLAPRRIHRADGRNLADCHSSPPHLRESFTTRFGPFPLPRFWGPEVSIESSRWIAAAARALEEENEPTLHLVYLPHLDHVLQRMGPDGEIGPQLREIDALCGSLVDFFTGRGCRVIVLSEYGVSKVDTPLHPNRMLREAGFLNLKTHQEREYLDPGASRAFAVADHQVAHVYVKRAEDLAAVKEVFSECRAIERILDAEGKRELGLDHERAGDLVLVAGEGAWFTYYFWNADRRAPDYARTVGGSAKPGYDPCELFVDPALRFPSLAMGAARLKQRLGLRALVEVVPLDARIVRGSHGRVPEDSGSWPVFLSTEPSLAGGDTLGATDVYRLLLDHVFD